MGPRPAKLMKSGSFLWKRHPSPLSIPTGGSHGPSAHPG
jgi:hypothetical protein